jgi:tripartite motif-containing protein 71
MVEAARAPRSGGVKPRTLVNAIILILLLALLALLIYFFFFMPAGGGIVQSGQKDVGAMRFLFAVYGPGIGNNPNFLRPLGVATDAQGSIFVADTGNSRICKFNNKGGFQWMEGQFGVAKPLAGVAATWKPGYFNFPYGIDVDDAGNIYVGDLDNTFISVFDSGGHYLRRIPQEIYKWVGKGSSGDSGGMAATALDVKGKDVYVCDKFQIIKFSTAGTFEQQFGMPGQRPGNMNEPNGVAVADDGTIFVSDSNNNRLEAFTPQGKVKWIVGAPNKGMGDTSPRVFGLPRGIDIGPDKNIYMADTFHFTIQVISPDGKRLAEVGEQGTGPAQFDFPNDVAVRSDGVIYVADRENNRIEAVQILKMAFTYQGG